MKGRKRVEPSKKVRHVILLVDASGSMRTPDVDLDLETRKDLWDVKHAKHVHPRTQL